MSGIDHDQLAGLFATFAADTDSLYRPWLTHTTPATSFTAEPARPLSGGARCRRPGHSASRRLGDT